jgi:hypothetical protein
MIALSYYKNSFCGGRMSTGGRGTRIIFPADDLRCLLSHVVADLLTVLNSCLLFHKGRCDGSARRKLEGPLTQLQDDVSRIFPVFLSMCFLLPP